MLTESFHATRASAPPAPFRPKHRPLCDVAVPGPDYALQSLPSRGLRSLRTLPFSTEETGPGRLTGKTVAAPLNPWLDVLPEK